MVRYLLMKGDEPPKPPTDGRALSLPRTLIIAGVDLSHHGRVVFPSFHSTLNETQRAHAHHHTHKQVDRVIYVIFSGILQVFPYMTTQKIEVIIIFIFYQA